MATIIRKPRKTIKATGVPVPKPIKKKGVDK
jgi:hypothetical protein